MARIAIVYCAVNYRATFIFWTTKGLAHAALV
jgi:hypothetical protein